MTRALPHRASIITVSPYHLLSPFRRWWLPLCLCALCAALQFTGLRDTWRFDRDLIDTGHWWLLLSGNFVHLNTNHLLMNLLGVGVIAMLVWHYLNAVQWMLCLVVSALAVGAGLYFRDPDLNYYVGLSGALHGLLLAGLVMEVVRYPKSGWILMIAVIGKLGFEQWQGAVPGSEWAVGGKVVVNSHLYGAIAGLAVGAVFATTRKRTPDPSSET